MNNKHTRKVDEIEYSLLYTRYIDSPSISLSDSSMVDMDSSIDVRDLDDFTLFLNNIAHRGNLFINTAKYGHKYFQVYKINKTRRLIRDGHLTYKIQLLLQAKDRNVISYTIYADKNSETRIKYNLNITKGNYYVTFYCGDLYFSGTSQFIKDNEKVNGGKLEEAISVQNFLHDRIKFLSSV